MKYFLIIGDGMADNPVKALDGKTPLEYASIPTIDKLAAKGVLGSVRNVPEGFQPGSDTAIMSIFGCAPQKYYAGRAPLEAAAQGVALEPGDAAFRCNNIAVTEDDCPFEQQRIVSHSAGSIGGDEARELITWLFNHPRFKPMADEAGLTVYPTSSYRHISVQKSTDITGLKLIAPHDHLGETVEANRPSGSPAAQTLMELMIKANELLLEHPINIARRAQGKLAANAVWFWAEGTAPKLPSFTGQYGKSGAIISAVPLCHGIAALVGLDVIIVEGATGELETNYGGKVEAALKAIKDYDFVTVHLEAPDECTHNGDLPGKLQAIEWLDSRIVEPIISGMEKTGEDFRVLILSDHKTLLEDLLHNGDPVPFLVYDSAADTGAGLPYTEKNGEKGVYLDDGTMLMPMLFQL